RRHVAAMMSGLDIHYDIHDDVAPGEPDAERHPLVGRRMPDLDLHADTGPMRVFDLLHEARPVLLDLGSSSPADVPPLAGRVRFFAATYEGAWELPVIGPVAAPGAVLIRPDGHVAWAGDPTDPALAHALRTWSWSG